ncbi:hypothetical protein FBU30_007306 [Linnemannia zychae]|nr:hypothetical protein FBU30_007306 [Linnemannia zychae]
MRNFPEADQRANLVTPKGYVQQYNKAKCELDYIPFAKSSSTVIRQKEFAMPPNISSSYTCPQAIAESERRSTLSDDARVPRLSGLYDGGSPSDTTEASENTLLSQAHTNPGLINSNNNSERVDLLWQHMLPTIYSDSESQCQTKLPILKPLPTFQQRIHGIIEVDGEEVHINSGRVGSEALIEMSPPLSRPRTEKLQRSTRLNEKYARMKSDMIMLAQVSFHRGVKHQHEQTASIAPWNIAFTPHSAVLFSQGRASYQLPILHPSQNPMCSPQVVQPALEFHEHDSELINGFNNSSRTHRLESDSTIPQVSNNKRMRLGTNLSCNQANSRNVTNIDGDTARVGLHDGRGGDAVFSTPHFRMSTIPARFIGNPSLRVAQSTKVNQADENIQEREEDRFDDLDLENFLDSESFFHHVA